MSAPQSADTLERWPSCVKNDLGDFMFTLNLRIRYKGEINGMKSYSGEDSTDTLISRMRKTLEEACTSSSNERYLEAMFRCTALLISEPVTNRQLIRDVCWSVLKLFNNDAMETTVACWDWLLAARPDLEVTFTDEMCAVWQYSVTSKLGLYSPDLESINPLEAYENNIPRPVLPPVGPHSIWTAFMKRRLAVSKDCNPEVVAMFERLMHRSLTGMNHHVDAIPGRFNLCHMGLVLLSGEVIPNANSKSVLRHRVYNAAFDYFIRPPTWPKSTGALLRRDIKLLISFWHVLYTDKKYLTKGPLMPWVESNAAGTLTSPKTPHSGANAISIPRVNTLQQGWHNTLPSTATMSAVSKKTSRKSNSDLESYLKDYTKRRNLLLMLVAYEVQRLVAWLNPLGESSEGLDSEDTLNTWRQQPPSDKSWRESVRLAWSISPELAVYLPTRIRTPEVISREVTRLVRLNPAAVSHLPDVLPYLVTSNTVEADVSELSHMLTWARVTPLQSLSYFSRLYPYHSTTAQYAIRVLRSFPPALLLFYVPQIVQALRFDQLGYISEFILWIVDQSNLLTHQLIWNMKVNLFRDEDGLERDPDIGDIIENLLVKISDKMSPLALSFYKREFEFFGDVTNISGEIKPYPKGDARKKACLKALARITVQPGCYLPSNPESVVMDIDKNSGTPMQSAAKAPFLARFRVRKVGVDNVERLAVEIARRGSDVGLRVAGGAVQLQWQAAIFKVGDDVRQDMLALQIISLFKNIFSQAGLDLFLFPYRVVATSPGCGVIECVPNAKSRDQIGRQTDIGMYEWFITKFGPESSLTFQRARRNFIRSMAAYSVIGFILQIKDRHNGNIMLDEDGHIIHIDFGFMFESSPGGNIGFEPDIKLTKEMVMIMGLFGDHQSGIPAPFKHFMEQTVRGFLCVRPYMNDVVNLVAMMLDTGLPCFRGRTLYLLKKRFQPQASEKDAASYMLKVINNSCMNPRTKTYDWIQYKQNEIPY